MTSRGPLTLAALASAAVPGLDPSTVEGVIGSGPAQSFDVAFVQDREHRRWVIRCPRNPAASAQLEQSAALLALLARRLTVPVPVVKGWVALPEGGRAAVHSYLTGRMVDLPSVAPGSRLAAGIGRALAQLHNLDRRIFEEAGVPVYDAETYRSRRLAELDRAAATGRVPTGLLTRWEYTLEDLSLWRFTTTPTHGAVGSSTILATPDDGEDPDVKALLAWESAQVADPADDLAVLVEELHPDTLDTVLEAYAHARADRPDRHLQQRARLVHQMQMVRRMMAAVAAGDDGAAEDLARGLRRLDDRLATEDERATADAAAAAPVAAAAGAQAGDAADEPADDAATEPTQEHPDEDADAATLDDATTDVIEVERTGDPPPVEDGATPTEPGDDADPSTDDHDDAADEQADDDSAEGDDAAETQADDQAGAAPFAMDHETAELTPLHGDDGDDVLPPAPRH